MPTVDLTLKADLSDLKKQLSEGVSKKEARKLVVELNRSIKAQTKAAKEAKKAMLSVQTVAKKAVNTAGMISAAALAGGAAFKALADDVAEVLNEITTLSAQTGLANETLGGLRLAAERTGKSLSDLVPPDLAKRIAETAQGTGEAKRGFDGLGVSVTDAAGNMKTADEVLRETIDALQKVEDPTTRSALAVQTLGDKGGQLLDTLGDSSSLEAFVDLNEKFGTSTGPASVQAVADLQSATAELSMVMGGLKQAVVEAFDVSDKVQNFTTGLVFAKGLVEGLTDEGREEAAKKFEDLSILAETEEKRAELIEMAYKVRVAPAFEAAAMAASAATFEFLTARKEIEGIEKPAADVAVNLLAKADADEEAAKAAKAAADADKERTKGIETLNAMILASELALADPLERVNLEFERQKQKINEAAAAAGDLELQTRALDLAQQEYNDSVAELVGEDITEAFDQLNDTMADSMQQIEEMIPEAAASFGEIMQGIGTIASEIEQIVVGFANLRIDQIEKVADAEREAIEQNVVEYLDAEKQKIDGLLAEGRISEEEAAAQMEAADRWAASEHQRADDLTKMREAEALKAFKIAQETKIAAATVAAALNAIEMTTALIPTLGPGAPFAAAAIAGGQLALAIATIKATEPPSFALGGAVSDRMGGSADHTLISASPSEGIVSPRGMMALGREGLDALNQGGSPATNVSIMLDRQIIASAVVDSISRDGRAANAVRVQSGARTGQTLVYGRG